MTSESPAASATDVSLSTPLTATFNEEVQSSTIAFTLTSSSGSSVAGTLAYNPTTVTATFTPNAALAYNTTYTAKVSGAENSSGTAMSAPVSWSFTTDPTAPAVTSESPASGATSVSISTMVTATFNEAVQAGTISLTLESSSGTRAPATVTYNSSNHTATVTLTAALAANTKYTATVSGALDTLGDPMAAPFAWSFTTRAAGPPAITSEMPASGATDVAVSTTVTATFNEAVQSSSIAFTLTNPSGSSVAATLSYNSSTHTATLAPSAGLAYNTTYTATVSGAKNSSGIPINSLFSWSFTTISPAALPPVLMTGVQTDLNKRRQITKIVITFSGPLDGVEAPKVGIYRLIVASKHGSFTTKTARVIRPRSVIYDAALGQVTLILKGPLSFSMPIQLQVNGQPPSGLRDSFGRYIDAGTNAVAVLRRGGVTIG